MKEAAEVTEAINAKGGTVRIATGNITTCAIRSGVVISNPADELLRCFTNCHEDVPGKIRESDGPITELQELPTIMTMRDAQSYGRADVRLTVKLFLQQMNADSVRECVDSSLTCMDTSHVDALIVTFPPMAPAPQQANGMNGIAHDIPDEQLPVPDITALQPVWQEMETLVDRKKVHTLGVADFTLPELAALYRWARVKPTILHFNITSCCTVPPELIQFAKANGVQILTHSDPPLELSPFTRLREAFGEKVACDWLCRETVFIKARSILLHKGYLIQLRSLD